ncbi:MAG: BACON domain-containing protein [Bacteroides sp.]|nr:BACON domain-containing protein [Bacteroides sp.]
MKKSKILPFLFMIPLLVCCEDPVESPDVYIEISDNEFPVLSSGGKISIEVDSNCDWIVENTPDWCNVTIDKSSEKPILEIVVPANETPLTRRATINLVFENISQSIYIIQAGEKEQPRLSWYTFPVHSITSVEYSVGNDNVKRIYRISGRELFINKKIKDQIFPGNLISNRLNTPAGLISYPEYTYKKVDVSAFVHGRSFVDRFIPSLQAVRAFADDIIESLSQQSNRFYPGSSPIVYHSYRHLNLLGQGNLGIELDKIISGSSYRDAEMTSATGLLYSYSQRLFTIDMDIPRSFIEEEITDKELLKDLSCVGSISYGRTAFLLVETDEDQKNADQVVRKLIKREELNAAEKSMVEEMNICFLYFDADKKTVIEKEKYAAIEGYINSSNTLPIIPLSFSAQDYSDSSPSDLQITYVLK